MGASAAYRLEDELRGGEPLPSSTAGLERRQPSLSRAPTMPVSSKAAVDDAADVPTSTPWCVDRGDWLEAMSTVSLWRALETGTLPLSTRVWREGLECWTPASEVQALYWTVSSHHPRAGVEADDHAVPSPCDGGISERGALPDVGGAPGALASSDGPESTGPLSFALTPEDLRTLAPRWSVADPTSSRGQRAEYATLPSRPVASAATREQASAARVSLVLSPSFPDVPPSLAADASAPPSAPVTLPSAVYPAQARTYAPDAPPASSVAPLWKRAARRLREPDDALPIAAGSAIAAIAIGLAVLNVLTPAQTVSAGARLELVPHLTAAVARTTRLPTPELARASGPAEAEDREMPAPVEVAPPVVKRVPVGRHEHGQVRLRRGRTDKDFARGFRPDGL